MSGTRGKGWNPYLAGALTGLVMIFSIWLTGKYFGASTTFVRTSGMLESLAAPDRVAGMPYFIKNVPKFDWQWLFVAAPASGSAVQWPWWGGRWPCSEPASPTADPAAMD